MKLTATDSAEFQRRLIPGLPTWLSSVSRGGPIRVIAANLLAGGFTNSTWGVTVAGLHDTDAPIDLVIRVPNPNGVSTPDDLGMAEQAQLLATLAQTQVPAPEVVGYEADPSVLGSEFLVMRKLAGDTGERYFPLEDRRREARLSAYAKTLARIHEVDWRASKIDTVLRAPTSQDCPSVALARVVRAVVARGYGDVPLVRRAIDWLEYHRPSSSFIRLVHGDPNLSNYRFAGETIVGVLDWEMAMLSDPLWDVAFYCGALPKFYAEYPIRIQERERRLFLDLYVDETGANLDHLLFWEVLFTLRAASGSQLTGMRGNQTPIYWQRLQKLVEI